jgi:ankyrin repeat protein
MDLSKFLASCLFLYLEDNVGESHIHTFAKLLFTTPDATTALPLVGGEQLKSDPTATFVLELLTRIRHCLCIYEIGDDVPNNDGVPFALSFFSWSARMLSYSEPSMHQKTRASFFALAGAQRVMWEAGVDVGPTALEWIEQYRTIWEGQKGRRLSTSATHVQVASFEFESDFPRYLAQIGTAEAWSTDFLTREKVHVTDHCIKVDVKFSGRLFPRNLQLPKSVKVVCEKLRMTHQQYLPEVLTAERYQGRVFVIGDSGSGKTLLTKQLFSEVAQQQLLGIRDQPGDMAGTTRISGMNLVPVRTPLIDLARQLEADPDMPLGADPICDLLSEWMQRKHGHDSIPHKLVYTVRNWCLGAADRASRRTSVLSASEAEDTARENAIGGPQPSEDIKALFLLFDGLDEAASSRLQVLEFIRSILQSEPSHLSVLTSRPGNLGSEEYDLLASLGFVSFRMGALALPQAEDMVQRTLTRAQETHEMISAVKSSVSDPGYSTLRENPLILTLLIHVLRKFQSQSTEGKGVPLTDDRTRKEVMKKTDIYQRAVKLILHQSDAAKFAMRDGASDQAMVRRLEMLKSVRARQLFQSMSFHLHQLRQRSTTWTAVEQASDDNDMIVVLKDAFQQGRMPILEKVEVFDAEPEVQLTHLSFQELMGGEYCSAIVGHAHSQKKMRAYVNAILSDSTQCLDRERLSEQWWLQVWFHVFEMLDSETLEQYCAILAEDERALLKVGSITLVPAQPYPLGYITIVAVCQGFPISHRPWEGDGNMTMVAAIHWDEYETDLVADQRDCNKRWFHAQFYYSRVLVPTLVDTNVWRLDGVGKVLRHAASLPDLDVLDTLLSKGVHPCLFCQDGHCLFALASFGKKWQAARVIREHRNDYDFLNFSCQNSWWTWSCGREEHTFVKTWDMSSTLDQLTGFKPYGTLQKAWDGTLTIADDVDVDFADPATGLRPLMLAASCGRVELVRTLIMHQASVNAKSSENCTALSMAADTDNGEEGLECMKLLINARADVHAKVGSTMKRPCWNLMGNESSILSGPALAGSFDKLKLLLESRADPDSPNNLDFAPLMQATRSNNVECVRLLVEHGSDFFRWSTKITSLQNKPGLLQNYNTRWNFMGWTPGADALHAWYMYAAENKDILRLAFELGMDGNTSMYLASIGYTWVPKVAYNLIMDYWGVIEGDSPVFKLYMKHGLDPNRPFSPQRLNLFMVLGWISNNGAMFTHMLENCPDPDEALAYRARYLGTVEVGARLLHNNAIVDAIEDYRRKRLENQETTSGTKS